MSELRIGVHGAAGRMGRRVVALAAESPECVVAAALDAPEHPELGKDAGMLAGVGDLRVPLMVELPDHVDVLIDFSTPHGAVRAARMCRERRIPLVMATTGLTQIDQAQVRTAAEVIPIVWSPNMSMAVNLTMKLVEFAARALRDFPGGVDVEIVERHHRYKTDAPSGTALRFGDLIAESLPVQRHVYGRSGQTGKRPRDEIGYHALRVGDNPGEHTIVFGVLGETVELSVRATNRDCYAHGALLAAQFVRDKSPGIYSMFDVLKL